MSSADNTKRTQCREAGHALLRAGFCVLPANRKTKYTTAPAWAEYQKRRPTSEEFTAAETAFSNALCVITGAVSGGLEMFDCDRPDIAEKWAAEVKKAPGGAELLARLYHEKSQSGNDHFYWKCPELLPDKNGGKPFPGNLKLAYYRASEKEAEGYIADVRKKAEMAEKNKARKAGKRATAEEIETAAAKAQETAKAKISKDGGYFPILLETRGEGGLSVCAPTEGYTPQRGTLSKAPEITPEERDVLLGAARTFNEKPADIIGVTRGRRNAGGGTRPGDDYNARDDARDKTYALLIEEGWTDTEQKGKFQGADVLQMARPGKDTRGASLFENSGNFHVFTSNAPPFEPGETYTPFAVLALLKYDGDYNAAAEALRREGYGDSGDNRGRPKVPVDEIAAEFLRSEFPTPDPAIPGLRFYRGGWYFYRDGWRELAKSDLEAYITASVKRQGYATSTQTVRNVYQSLTAADACTLTADRYTAPCRISTGEHVAELLPLANCLIDTRRLLPHGVPDVAGTLEATADYFILNRLPVAFDVNADCPKWERYLEDVQPCEENRDCLQMLAGLLLTADTRYNVAFILYGEGGTGKSVFIDTIRALLGDDNVCAVKYSALGDRFGRVALTNRLANIVDEMGVTTERGGLHPLEEEFKKITQGAEICVERKGGEPFFAEATARMVFTTNEMPYIRDRSEGVWDRIRIIPFNHRIRGTRQENKNLRVELREELPGILLWALRGLTKLRGLQRFPESKEGEEVKERNRLRCDHEADFLEQYVETGSGCTPVQDMYQRYATWARSSGYYPTDPRRFADAVKRAYPGAEEVRKRIEKNGSPVTIWAGLQLREEAGGCASFSGFQL